MKASRWLPALALAVRISVPTPGHADPAPLATPTPVGPTFFGEVEVRRVSVEVRVLGRDGEPVLGLGPADFKVSVDGVPTLPESADWMSWRPPERTMQPPESKSQTETSSMTESTPTFERPPRLVVLFFQLDFGFASERISGLMRMAQRAARFVAELNPNDLVAVVSYESHLDLRLDLTSDRDRVLHAVKATSIFGHVGEASTPDDPSLADHLDHRQCLDATKPETALRLVAEALEPLRGDKAIVLFGWGLGRLQGRRVVFPRDYGGALAVLTRAHIPVYSIDITEADSHTLEVGLQRAAADTGGFYAKTFRHPAGAMRRLEAAMSGHYVLTFSSPVPERGWHSLLVEVEGVKGARVYAKNSFVD
jgi:VWFA-related protein